MQFEQIAQELMILRRRHSTICISRNYVSREFLSVCENVSAPSWRLRDMCGKCRIAFPDKEFVNQMYVHNLEKLFRLNGALWAQLQADMQTDAKLSINWSTVKDWDDSKRYDVVDELAAKSLHDAATEAGSGIVEWVRRKW
jgi:hypothetical protein